MKVMLLSFPAVFMIFNWNLVFVFAFGKFQDALEMRYLLGFCFSTNTANEPL